MDLFKSTCNNNTEHVFRLILRCITEEMNTELIRPVDDKEVLATFNQMDTKEAPGSDGLLGLFFR